AQGSTLALGAGLTVSTGDGASILEVFSGGISVGTIVNSGALLELNGAELDFAGASTFDNGTINLADGGVVSSGTSLTFGANALVNHTSGNATLSGDSILNSGTIAATGTALTIAPANF